MRRNPPVNYDYIKSSGNYVYETRIGIYRQLPIQTSNRIAYFGEDKLISVSTQRSLVPDDGISVGNCISGQVSARFYCVNDSWEKIEIPKKAVIQIQVRAVSTENSSKSGWFAKGVFFVDRKFYDPDTKIVDVVGFDALANAGAIYIESFENGNVATDIRSVVQYIASLLSISVNTDTLNKLSPAIQYPTSDGKKLYKKTLCREMLAKIASGYLANFIVNDDGMLTMVAVHSGQRDATDIDKNCREFSASEREYLTGMNLFLDKGGETESFSYGNDNDLYFYVSTIWGEEGTATAQYNAIVRELFASSYFKPYSARGTIIDPFYLELGDLILINGEYAQIDSQKIYFGKLMASDISSPSTRLNKHEFLISSDRELALEEEISQKTDENDVNNIVQNVLSDYETVTVSPNTETITNYNFECRYLQHLGLVFIRGSFKNATNTTANTWVTVANIPSDYRPSTYNPAITVSAPGGANGLVTRSDGNINIRTMTDRAAGTNIDFSGWWYV